MVKTTANAAIVFEQCIPSILSLYGLKKTRDYTISKGQVRVKSKELKNKVAAALKEFCPEKHYYWETSRILRWF